MTWNNWLRSLKVVQDEVFLYRMNCWFAQLLIYNWFVLVLKIHFLTDLWYHSHLNLIFPLQIHIKKLIQLIMSKEVPFRKSVIQHFNSKKFLRLFHSGEIKNVCLTDLGNLHLIGKHIHSLNKSSLCIVRN
jgi:hypothetical protein